MAVGPDYRIDLNDLSFQEPDLDLSSLSLAQEGHVEGTGGRHGHMGRTHSLARRQTLYRDHFGRAGSIRRSGPSIYDRRPSIGPSSLAEEEVQQEVTDEDIYHAALGIAYLDHLLRPSVQPLNRLRQTSFEKKAAIPSQASSTKRHSKTHFSISSLSDVLTQKSSSSAKLPKNFLKILKTRLQDIAKGSDELETVHNTDQSLRAVTGIFYGKFSDPSWIKSMKESRGGEELILHWTTVVQAFLKKRGTFSADQARMELDRLVIVFVKILIQCLRTKEAGAPLDMIGKLEDYHAKLAGLEPAMTRYPSRSEMASVHSLDQDAPDHSSDLVPLAQMPLVKAVGKLFSVTDARLSHDLSQMRDRWTQRMALNDLKFMLGRLGQVNGSHGPNDFESQEAYEQWRQGEAKTLGQLIMSMIQINPSLTNSSNEPLTDQDGVRKTETNGFGFKPISTDSTRLSPIPSRPRSRQSSYNHEPPWHPDSKDHTLTFVPNQPEAIYTRLLDRCIEADLASFADLSPEDEVSTRILSKDHIALLNECGIRWRLNSPFRSIAFLDMLRERLDQDQMPMECISDALDHLKKLLKGSSYHFWTLSEQDSLCWTLLGLCMTLIGFVTTSVKETTGHLDWEYPSVWIDCVDELMDASGESPWPLARREEMVKELDQDFEQVELALSDWAQSRYRAQLDSLSLSPDTGERGPLDYAGILFLMDWIAKSAKKAGKDVPVLFGKIDVKKVIMQTQTGHFFADLERLLPAAKELASRADSEHPQGNEDEWSIFFRLRSLQSEVADNASKGGLEKINIGDWFLPTVQAWLSTTSTKTHEWVLNAVRADTFVSIDEETRHSTSVVDLFSSFNQAHKFVSDLDWPDELQNARFVTHLSKTFSGAVDEYCEFMRDLFADDMYRVEQEPLPARQLAWLAKAKQTLQDIQGEKTIEPFHFSAKSCVKLNNIEAAKMLLDNLYKSLNADKISSMTKRDHKPVVQRQSSLWTIKVIEANNLRTAKKDTLSNAYVVLSNQSGHRVAKTRMVFDIVDPVWKESFDVSSDGPLWLAATIWDKDSKSGEHEVCGRCFIQLDPAHYDDFLVHDNILDLDTQGTLSLQASMEGEKDDIQFYFGRAFRSLERSRDEMVKTVVDRMSTTIRQCLSRRLLKVLLYSGLDSMEKAINGVTALYHTARDAARSGKYTVMSAGSGPSLVTNGLPLRELSDIEVEKAIGPLLDYFDMNLKLLNEHLYDEVFDALMVRVWKQVVMSIEELLVPPLSDKMTSQKSLSDKEVDIAYKWLNFLKNYFHHNGEGISLDELSIPKYRDLMVFRLYYDMDTDTLMQECVHSLQIQLAANRWPTMKRKMAREGSVMNHRNLGTIRKVKALRQQELQQRPIESNAPGAGATETGINNGEIILRILRMRPNTGAFLKDQMRMLKFVQEQGKIRPAARPLRNHR